MDRSSLIDDYFLQVRS